MEPVLENLIPIHARTLSNRLGPIPSHSIDYLYIQGYISDDDYCDYYMDATRMHRPVLVDREKDMNVLEALEAICIREEIVENKNRLLRQAEQCNELLQ